MPIFIELTTADGQPVMVNSSLVNLYGAVDEGNGRNTMLDIDGTHLYVQESMEEVANRIRHAVRVYEWAAKEGRDANPYIRH